ncbi:Fur family transcriptional regulator, zinc uptake regulator [Andreprevotia lacus DSM 23236]|jgi:Fur family zinc uptake transcriptional regulator|uniref:Fur family transcriptional regulator, zinc uptake regulator n=1 Tax=Andreprevotia lacus DSM 23236 TaxID=1121001 RepID=A0A1W1XJ75_9NEIS|nr:Fur family transcriptional regulator [Andreprevotia lacus]SMC23877.1 Fur family transcriptional regulator, zinc uptake regulator [Andreprevotia lacus DSM 23236]
MTHTHPQPASTDIEARLAHAENRCREHGSRLTPIRRQVLGLLLKHGHGVKAYQLVDEMKSLHASTTPPTVYRALEFLQAEGLVHRLDMSNAFVACSAQDDAHGHVHHGLLLACPRCNAVAEVPDEQMSHALAAWVHQAGYRLEGESIEIKALCPACQKIASATA